MPETEFEIIQTLKREPTLFSCFCRLNDNWRQRFLDFCMGKISLPLTYEPFFKVIFHPDVHPDRLSDLISSLLNMKVKIVRILPNEDSMMDGETLMIMDILGELEDGALINVEIQKQGYAFPAERISCYSSDLVMRQYNRVKGKLGRSFTYRDIKKVYVIVLMEKTNAAFHNIPEHYIHYGKTIFNTGLNMELLQEFCLVALDVFQKFPYPKIKSEQTAWLSLLTTENWEAAQKLIQEYPWLEEIYQEIAMLRQEPEEVLGMFSEALRILDRNTASYMIEELQKECERQKEAYEHQKLESQQQKEALIQKDIEISELKRQLASVTKNN